MVFALQLWNQLSVTYTAELKKTHFSRPHYVIISYCHQVLRSVWKLVIILQNSASSENRSLEVCLYFHLFSVFLSIFTHLYSTALSQRQNVLLCDQLIFWDTFSRTQSTVRFSRCVSWMLITTFYNYPAFCKTTTKGSWAPCEVKTTLPHTNNE